MIINKTDITRNIKELSNVAKHSSYIGLCELCVSIKIMLNLENLKKIIKTENGYQIIFNDHITIKIKNKKSILPLLFLIKYGESGNSDYGSERYNEVMSLIKDKCEVDIGRCDYENNRPYSDLITEEGFTFIIRKMNGHRVYYKLYKKDHRRLCENNQKDNRFDEDLLKEIYSKQLCTCSICHMPYVLDKLYPDLIKPIFRGGVEETSNIQLICSDCKAKKDRACKNCVELCSNMTCPLNYKTITAMNIHKIAMKKTK